MNVKIPPNRFHGITQTTVFCWQEFKIEGFCLIFFYFCVSLKCDEATSYYQGMDEKEATKRGYVLIDNYMVYNFTLGSQGYDGPVWIGYSTHS